MTKEKEKSQEEPKSPKSKNLTPDRSYYLEGHYFNPGDKLGKDGIELFDKHKAHYKPLKE